MLREKNNQFNRAPLPKKIKNMWTTDFQQGIKAFLVNKTYKAVFNKRYQNSWISTYNRMSFDPHFKLYIIINSKCIKNLNIKPQIIILLGEKNGFGNDFLDVTPKIFIEIFIFYKNIYKN